MGSMYSRAKCRKGAFVPLASSLFLAGWHHQYETTAAYFKFAATPKGRSKHQEFLQKRKVAVKQLEEETASGVQHNQNVMKRKDLQSIVQAATTTVSLQNRTGRRLVNQGQREFVPEGSWDEALDGKWDASKVVAEDYGKGPVKGVWVM